MSVEAVITAGRCWPVIEPKITSPYGRRIDPITGQGSFHDGIDLASPRGSQVMAISDGVVDGDFDSYEHKLRFLHRRHWSGNWVSIRHEREGADPYWSVYVHLERNVVRHGERVEAGQVIGHYADVGRSTGPHLHLSIVVMQEPKSGISSPTWVRVDPRPYLPEAV